MHVALILDGVFVATGPLVDMLCTGSFLHYAGRNVQVRRVLYYRNNKPVVSWAKDDNFVLAKAYANKPYIC